MCAPERAWARTDGRVLGNRFDLEVDGDEYLIDIAIDRLRRIEAALSRLLPMSELNRLNARPGQDVPVSDDLGWALREAIRLHRATGGRYDPSILPALDALGVTISDEGTARLAHGTRLDLSGLECGYAVDRVVEDLVKAGAGAVRCRVGDSFRAVDPNGWNIEIKHPAPDEVVTHHTLGMSTSGNDALASVLSPRISRNARTPLSGQTDPSTVVRLAVVSCAEAVDAQALAEAAVASSPSAANAMMSRANVSAWLLTPIGVVIVRPD